MDIGAGFTPWSQKSTMQRPHIKHWTCDTWIFKTPSLYGWGIRVLGCHFHVGLRREKKA